jgi:hypothetical protein
MQLLIVLSTPREPPGAYRNDICSSYLNITQNDYASGPPRFVNIMPEADFPCIRVVKFHNVRLFASAPQIGRFLAKNLDHLVESLSESLHLVNYLR